MNVEETAVVIGAGPAGLTAAYLLTKESRRVIVLEADAEYVGGLSRTVLYRGFRFDIGGHRFFSKSQEVEDLWTELLGDDLLERPRSSRIHYAGQFFAYPIRPFEILQKLGVIEATRCVLSYIAARLVPTRHPRSVEDWVTNQFGRRLYRMFFKTYTEKVWGMSCRDISADWAAQRIKGLSLTAALWSALFHRQQGRANAIKTLISKFRYPRLGPGMMWERCRDRIVENGGEVLMGRRVCEFRYLADRRQWHITAMCPSGETETFAADHVITSAPMRELVETLDPPPPEAVVAAARSLRYRDFLVVALILKERANLQDNWIYVHEPDVRVGRIQIFKSWSPELVPDASLTCYGMEYFCFEGDGLWAMSDSDLRALAERELVTLGLATSGDVIDAHVVRQRKAYPVYDADYERNVGIVRAALDEAYAGLHLVGRNGMHKYNNQDHAMMTAMLTVRNVLADARVFDAWAVNEDAEYHEELANHGATGERLVPRALAASTAARRVL